MSETTDKIQSTLSNLDPIIRNLGGLTDYQKAVLSNSANVLSQTYSTKVVSDVTNESNFEINSIIDSAKGPNNPLDIVSKNLLPSDVESVLDPVIASPLGAALTGSFVTELTSLFKNTLGTTATQNLDLPSITNALDQAVGGLMSSSIGTALKGFTNQLLSGKVVPPVINVPSDIFSTGGIEQGLERVQEQFSSAVTNKARIEAKNFNINAPDNRDKLVVTKTGFLDPTASFPTKEYANRPETNKLATGDIKGTVVQQKEKERMKGAQLPSAESWDQPTSPYKGEYPYNKVIQTESGHIIEMDDSPGAERLHVYHRSGTFIEIDANGCVIKRTKGSSYEIIDRNNYLAVSGKQNISINGACNIFVGADCNIEVEGDTNVLCKNDITMQAHGRIDMSASEEINIHSKKVRIESDEEMHIVSDGKYDVTVDKMNLKVAKDILQSADNSYTTLEGKMSVNAQSTVDVDGSAIYWNSGTSESKEVEQAENAAIGIIPDYRKDINETIIPDPIATNYTDLFNVVAEDTEDPAVTKQNQDQMVRDGIVSKDELSEPVVPSESTAPAPAVSEIILPPQDLLNATELPENYQLSKHFTVGMLTTKAAVSMHKLQAQAGLTYGQVAYNLAGLALNVLEPIKALYPNMLVTSCFRAPGANPTSQHPRGQAVDIQIPGVSKKDYYEIAKTLAKTVIYDQFLLEYKTTGSGLPWLHISLDVTKTNRKQTLTFLNDKKYSEGLTQLA